MIAEPSPLSDKNRLPLIILASGSPRRKELFAALQIPFQVVSPPINEKEIDVTGLSPTQKALFLAESKGKSVTDLYPNALVIAADTLVVCNGEILEKPESKDEAFEMLTKLQGTEHSVFSAIAVFYQGRSLAEALETRVKMKALTPQEIWRYIETEEPMDKAGAYAIQGYGSVLIEWIEGCYFNVVGMSMNLLHKLCHNLGVKLIF